MYSAHFAQEGFDAEGGVPIFFEFFDHERGFVFGEEAGDSVCDAAGGADEWVFGFGVAGFEGED